MQDCTFLKVLQYSLYFEAFEVHRQQDAVY